MYMGFFGIIDAVIILLALLFMFIGFKRGFMNKMITILCVLVLIGLSIMFAGNLSEMLKDYNFFYKNINDGVNASIVSSMTELGSKATAKVVFSRALHLPDWLSWFTGMFVSGYGDQVVTASAQYNGEFLTTIISNKATMFYMRLIAFTILFVGMTIVFIILKAIANALRENSFIRVVDGILGMALYLLIFAAIVSVVFFVLDILVEKNVISSTTGFIAEDFQLMDTTKFSMSRWLLKGNLISVIRNMFVK